MLPSASPNCDAGAADTLKVYELSQEGEYVARDTSICFPTFPIARGQIKSYGSWASAHETGLLVGPSSDWVGRQRAG